MRLSIISDTHFGYAYGTELQEDSFIQGAEAIQKAIDLNSDVILLAGDIFDSRVPSQDVLARAAEIFQKPLLAENKNVKLAEMIGKKKEDISELSLKGVPVIAIYGTHERRGKGLTNPIQLLEKAGLLINLHCSCIVLGINGEKLAVHGMSGVPENYARVVLEKWAPKPVKTAFNIFMFHQSVEQYVYSDDESAMLKIEDLPRGFELFVDGHIHWNDVTDYKDSKFMLPGSTISTQMRKIESEKPKGFYFVEIEKGNFKTNFVKLETPRILYYKQINFDNLEPTELCEKIEKDLDSIKTSTRKPLVRLSLKGTLKKGFESSDVALSKLEQKFKDKFILSIGKEKITTRELLENKSFIEEFRKKQLSVDELGLEILKNHLREANYSDIENAEELFNKLVGSDEPIILNFLKEKIK